MFPTTSRTQTTQVFMRLIRWLEVGGAVSEQACGTDGFGEDNADGDEDGAGSGREGNSDFDASALGIFIAAAKSDAALGKIFADCDFFLKTATANAGENAGFDAGAITAGDDAIFFSPGSRGGRVGGSEFGLRFDPDGWRFTDFANAGNAFARFEGL